MLRIQSALPVELEEFAILADGSRYTCGSGRLRHAAEQFVPRLVGLSRPAPAAAKGLVEDDEIAPYVNVYVEGEDVRTLDGLDTSVDHGSTVILLPAMAGGL